MFNKIDFINHISKNNISQKENKNQYTHNSNDNRMNFAGICSTGTRLLRYAYDEAVMYSALFRQKLSQYDTQEVLDYRQQLALMQAYFIKKYGVVCTYQLKNREELRDNIAEILIKDGKPVQNGQKPNAVILMGIPGSGKSTILEKEILNKEENYVSIDFDEPGHYLPEYKNLFPEKHKEKFYYLTTMESQDIADRALDKSINRRLNVILHNPGLDYSELVRKAQKLKASGYNVSLKFVNIDTDKAVEGCMKRCNNGGRFADPVIHAKMGDWPAKNYLKLVNNHPELFDCFNAYFNDGQALNS